MTSHHRLGELLHEGERTGLRFVRDLSHSPDRVWRALTESDQLRHWMPVDLVGPRKAGAAITVPFWADVADKYEIADAVLPGEILVWEPPRIFSWRWDTDTLIFELHPTDTGTRLEFTTWIGGGPPVNLVAAGYHVCLDQLTRLVDDGSAPPFIDQSPSGYEVLYAESFGMDISAPE
jgi:uncharacterized protein YndB with AHSA1/START domain